MGNSANHRKEIRSSMRNSFEPFQIVMGGALLYHH